MFVALNGVSTALYDSRPVITDFLRKKERRYRKQDLYLERGIIQSIFQKDVGL